MNDLGCKIYLDVFSSNKMRDDTIRMYCTVESLEMYSICVTSAVA